MEAQANFCSYLIVQNCIMQLPLTSNEAEKCGSFFLGGPIANPQQSQDSV